MLRGKEPPVAGPAPSYPSTCRAQPEGQVVLRAARRRPGTKESGSSPAGNRPRSPARSECQGSGDPGSKEIQGPGDPGSRRSRVQEIQDRDALPFGSPCLRNLASTMPRAPSSKGSAESDGLRPGGRPPTRRGSEDITDSIQHLRPARPQNLSCQRAEPPRRRRQSDIDDAEYLPSAATKPRQLAEAEPAVPGKSRPMPR
jgi:hypothetical protein